MCDGTFPILGKMGKLGQGFPDQWPFLGVPPADFSWQNSATCWQYKTLYPVNVPDSNPVEFRGSSLEDLRGFPLTARRGS